MIIGLLLPLFFHMMAMMFGWATTVETSMLGDIQLWIMTAQSIGHSHKKKWDCTMILP